jgi:hypothetical protein
MPTPTIQAREARVRRRLARDGQVLRKSRIRYSNADDYGEYMIVDANYNFVVAGDRFTLSLEEIERQLSEEDGKENEAGKG